MESDTDEKLIKHFSSVFTKDSEISVGKTKQFEIKKARQGQGQFLIKMEVVFRFSKMDSSLRPNGERQERRLQGS